jgi:hypothetical protein
MAQQTSQKIVTEMLSAINQVKTLKYKLKKTERIDATFIKGQQDIKFTRSPKRVYTYIYYPNKGVEVLWKEGEHKNEAYVNPNAFPYINVRLNPMGSHMRNNNHHTVNEVGFDYIGSIVNNIASKNAADFANIFKYEGDVKFDERDCYKIVIDYYPFKFIPYTVKAGENLTSIAKNNFVSDYMILKANKNIEDYNDVVAGQQIMIPNAYARKTVLYIDKATYLPISQAMFDDKGLYGQYEYYDVILNSVIPEEEFSSDFSKYGF